MSVSNEEGFKMECHSDASGSKQVIHLFIYKDWLQTKLLGVCKVIVTAVATLDVQVTAKQETEHVLKV